MYELKKKFTISCMHKLENKNLSEEENKKLFGKCYLSKDNIGHGHNWDIIVILRSEKLDEKSGMIMNFSKIKKIFNKLIHDVYDHKPLNNCPEFNNNITTAENMSKIFYDILKVKIPQLYKIEVFENINSCASYWEDLKHEN